MARKSWCDDCFRAVRHDGTPQGQFVKIGGVDCYVAVPDIDYNKTAVLLFLPDAFGVQLVNSQLLADDFARNGLKTVIPDYFEGDPYPSDGFSRHVDVPSWISRHGPETVQPLIDNVIQALKVEGVNSFIASGYCFGARYTVDLARENITKAIVLNHPAFLELPEDFRALRETSKNPLLINSCPGDSFFPDQMQRIADQELENGAYKPGYERLSWEGCSHGFTIRGDLNNPFVKRGKEGAFKAAIGFFHNHI